MALAIPGVYLVGTRGGSGGGPRDDRAEPPPMFRLPPNHVQDLRDVARGVEETNAGVCCRYLVDQLAGGGRQDIDEDGYAHHLEAAEKFCERYGVWRHPLVASWRNRVRRARRALSLLRAEGDHESAAVLHVAHGYPDPIVHQLDLGALGELGSLARYTEPVERRRRELARAEAARGSRSEPYVPARLRPHPEHFHERHVVGLSAAIAHANEAAEVFRLAAKHAPKGTPPPKQITEQEAGRLFDLERHRSVVEHADRATSSSDALRDALHFEPKGPRETDDAYRERRKREKDQRGAFVLEVKLAAVRMLSHAEKAYHLAWFRSAASGSERTHDAVEVLGMVPPADVDIPPARVRGSGWSAT